MNDVLKTLASEQLKADLPEIRPGDSVRLSVRVVEGTRERLQNFVGRAAQATRLGDVFDDAATGQGLLNYFLRALQCGAIGEDDAVHRSGLTLAELRGRSFVAILQERARA